MGKGTREQVDQVTRGRGDKGTRVKGTREQVNQVTRQGTRGQCLRGARN